MFCKTSSLSFSNIRYWAFHWDSGPPTIVTLLKHEIQNVIIINKKLCNAELCHYDEKLMILMVVTFSAPL